jgi:hypothetical protein
MNRVGECGCAEVPKAITHKGGRDASETAAVRGGVSEYVHFGAGKKTFSTYAERYAYLRGKAACSGGTITFPCCSATTSTCG